MAQEKAGRPRGRAAMWLLLLVFGGVFVSYLAGCWRGTEGSGQTLTGTLAAAAPEDELTPVSAASPEPDCVTRDCDPAVLPSADCRAVIEEFLLRGMRAQMTLNPTGVTGLFRDASADALFNQAALELTVAVRALQPNDLTVTAATVGITYEGLEENPEGSVTVYLSEDDTLRFSFLGGRESFSAGIGHIFVLTDTAEGVRILAHEREEDAFLLLEEVFSEECVGVRGLENLTGLGDGEGEDALLLASVTGEAELSAVREALARAQASLTTDAEETLKLRQQALADFLTDPEGSLHPPLTYDVAYDSAAALSYAARWAGTTQVVRNPEWDVYDGLGGNCMNFVSQCLYAGGIPMDASGSACQWKYYGSEINGREQTRGRSASWTGVGHFYEYALYNEGYGLAAWVGANDWAGRPGDVLQLGAFGDARHAVLITEVIYNAEGQPVDYLLSSNTTDHSDFPASAYGYTSWELIQILGYNRG